MSKLGEFVGLAGLKPRQTPLAFDLDAQGHKGVCLQTPLGVMETAVEADLAGANFAQTGEILDPLDDLVPGEVEFVGGSVAGRGDGMVGEDQWVESDDLAVTVQNVQGQLAGHACRDRRDDGVLFFFAQHDG